VASGQSFGPTGTTALTVAVGVEAQISVTNATTNLTDASAFADYAGTTNLVYKIRTAPSTGTGSITAQVTSDFSPANGPSVATPPNAGDALTYTCTVSAPGTACAGTQTASTTVATSVATFGADAHSVTAGNSASVAWTLTNDAAYRAGTYSATVTFTVSAM
jgi:hypothetical protein